jgi:hypothetical protein
LSVAANMLFVQGRPMGRPARRGKSRPVVSRGDLDDPRLVAVQMPA